MYLAISGSKPLLMDQGPRYGIHQSSSQARLTQIISYTINNEILQFYRNQKPEKKNLGFC